MHLLLCTPILAQFLFCLQHSHCSSFLRAAFIHSSFCTLECNFVLFNLAASSTFQLVFSFFLFGICCDSYTLFLMFASDRSTAAFTSRMWYQFAAAVKRWCSCFFKSKVWDLLVLGKPDLNASLGTSLLRVLFSLGALCVLWMYWGSYFAIVAC